MLDTYNFSSNLINLFLLFYALRVVLILLDFGLA
jgi:hypothetical protein